MEPQSDRPEVVRISAEVRQSIADGRGVVALETAVVTHGLPPPANLDVLSAMEEAIRAEGAVPAVCLVQDAYLWIGADTDRVAVAARDAARQKASVRDLGAAIARSISAGLTVSATLFAARLAGIRVFATGGIGGVHLGAAQTGDISADLLQLARVPIITVCSGAKSVLDIPRTLEFLEMAGVPVFSYRSSHFPAFYLRQSGVQVTSLESVEEIARVAKTQWSLGHEAGLVIGNPIPTDAALDPEEWATWLDAANDAAARDAIQGKDVTPYLLDRVAGYSGGRTVAANVALLINNARLAAQIACALPP
jgi:pseudouridine-5'-phosphate glycosidase